MNAKLEKYIEQGYSRRHAYRLARHESKAEIKPDFDYEKETPKGEWV